LLPDQGTILWGFFQVPFRFVAEFRKKPERTPKEYDLNSLFGRLACLKNIFRSLRSDYETSTQNGLIFVQSDEMDQVNLLPE
jgi:hypothetical protein